MKGWVHIFDFKLFAQPIDNIFLVHLVVVGSIAGCSKASERTIKAKVKTKRIAKSFKNAEIWKSLEKQPNKTNEEK